jgi:hypothetical protein
MPCRETRGDDDTNAPARAAAADASGEDHPAV